MPFIGSWFITAIATAAAIWLVPGIEAVGGTWAGPIFCALALAFVNAVVKPVMTVLSIPITILTLGIFYLVINALMSEEALGRGHRAAHEDLAARGPVREADLLVGAKEVQLVRTGLRPAPQAVHAHACGWWPRHRPAAAWDTAPRPLRAYLPTQTVPYP